MDGSESRERLPERPYGDANCDRALTKACGSGTVLKPRDDWALPPLLVPFLDARGVGATLQGIQQGLP
jgi:hypothetical protein